MSTEVFSALGGLGLFLLGMRLMTEGLRKLAGDRLHRWLARVTRTPVSGAATGALTTAVVQSSSATTVAAVGFVGAGLLTYEQSLGVIFGANIGTTLTGWIVALLGFKVKLGPLSLLLVFGGALLMLLTRKAGQDAGRALAGFALLFLGIDFLKDGLAASADAISLEQFSSASFWGRLVLVGVGLVLTVLTQSSSATVATTLAALSSGILDLPQALAVVIGADVGTTATAWLATLGGSTASRRTGISHVVYNFITGLVAFLSLPLYHATLLKFFPDVAESNAAIATVGFHTAFNVLGVVLVLPFTRSFANLMRRLVPDRHDSLGSVLEPRLAANPAVAFTTLRSVISQIVSQSLTITRDSLASSPDRIPNESYDVLEHAISDCRQFMGSLSNDDNRDLVRSQVPDLIHLCDHTERLLERCRDHERVAHLSIVPSLQGEAGKVRDSCCRLLAWLTSPADHLSPARELDELADRLETDHGQIRHDFISATVEGVRSPVDLDSDLDALRWLRRCSRHLARICHYLEDSGVSTVSR